MIKAMKQFKLLLVLAFVNLAFAQHNTSGELTTVKENGLYQISLPNQIRSFSNRNLSDFRILDTKGIEVPYFIREKTNSFKTSEYVKFDIESKNSVKDSTSSIVFKNPFKIIETLVLTTANYSGSKRYKVLGSNDLTNWFGVVNTGYLSNINGLNSTSVDKTITFPRCNYKYLKIKFNDIKSLPINVLKVGGFANAITNRELQKVTVKSLTTVDLTEEKTTQIYIQFNNKEIINQVQFKVLAPEFYNRKVTIYKKESRTIKNKKQTYNRTLATLQLNSKNETIFYLSEIFEDDIYIEIENKDSNKLTVSDIHFFQKPLYVIAFLKANENYTIKTGDKTMDAPEYDLSFFRNNISENLPTATINNIVKQEVEQAKAKEKSFWQTTWFMWICIAITAFVILYFTSSLVKDLKK